MKKVISYLKTFIKEDFNVWLYTYTVLFLAVTIYLNYNYQLEYKWVNQYNGTYPVYFFAFTFNAFAYYMIAIPMGIFGKENYLQKSAFWIKSSLFLLLLSIDGSFFHHSDFVYKYFSETPEEKYYLLKLSPNLYPTIFYMIFLFLIKSIYDKNESGLYGFTFRGFDYQIYFIAFIVMIPIIFWASFQSDFLHSYPQFKPWLFEEAFGLSRFQMSFIFEFFYGLDFVSVELIFRGALVIGLSSLMGRSVILPMVVTYAFLHFGKPMAETIGSIFGGYILGVIAFYSRNILGGCVIHIGVALLMEVMALLQYYVFQK